MKRDEGVMVSQSKSLLGRIVITISNPQIKRNNNADINNIIIN